MSGLRTRGNVDVTGETGDADVLTAIADALRHGSYDAVIVATGEQHLAASLGIDLAERVERTFGVPVTELRDPNAHSLGPRSLGLGIAEADEGTRPPRSTRRESPRLSLAWPAVVVLIVLFVAIGTGIALLIRHNPATANTVPRGASTLTITVGGPETHGATEELTGYYPATIEAHPGDTLVFHNDTVDVPHTVTFGVARNRSNEPKFGKGRPNVTLVQPCTSRVALATTTDTCATGSLAPFDGQPYYSSGIIAPRASFTMHLAFNLAPGAYDFGCLIHPAQQGTLLVVPRNVAIQSSGQLRFTAAQELNTDRRAIATLLKGHVTPAAEQATVQAGVTIGEVSYNQYFPSTVTVHVGQTVTWINPAHRHRTSSWSTADWTPP